MNVRIIAPQGYGDRYGDFHPHGEHVDYPDVLAHKLILHKIATRVHEKQPVIETTEMSPPENAARTTKPKPRGPAKGFSAKRG